MFVFSHAFPVLWKSTFPMFWVLGIVWISASREICKKHLTLECSVFSYFSRTIRNHFSHVLGTILLMWRLMKIFYFLYHFHTNVYVKLFNIPMNMAIGIRLKIDTSELQQKCFWGDFPQLLELHLLRTHIGGSFKVFVCRKFAKYLGKATMIESF